MAFIAKTDWKQSDLVETIEFNRINQGVVDNKTTLTNHIADKNNPHNVTKAQVGLSDVDNTSLASKPTSRIYQKEVDKKAYKNLSNVTAKDFKNKAIIAGVGGDIIPDNKVRFNIQLTSEDGGGIANAFVYAIINNITIADALTSDTGQTLIEIEPDNNTSVTIKVTPSNNRYEETNVTYDNINSYLGTSQNITINLEKIPIITYGFTIDATNSNPDTAIVYTDDCAGWTPIRGDANGNIDMGSWANKWPLTAIRPCLYKDGEVVAYLNPNDYTKTVDGTDADITTGDAGDVMIEIPTIYYKVEPVKDASGVTTSSKITISDTEQEGFDCYAHYRINSADINTYPSPTIKLDYIYIGAYLGTTLNASDKNIRSLSRSATYALWDAGYSSATPHPNNTYKYPTHLLRLNVAQYTLIKLLFVLLVKSINSDHFFKRTASATVTTGWGNKLGMFAIHSEKATSKFLGMENLWTYNKYTFIDELSAVNNVSGSSSNAQGRYNYMMMDKTGRTYNNRSNSYNYPSYTFMGAGKVFADSESEGYATRYYKPIIDNPFILFLPAANIGNASVTTYTCDGMQTTNQYGNTNSNCSPYVGYGGWTSGGTDGCGLFSTYAVGNAMEYNDTFKEYRVGYYTPTDAFAHIRLGTGYYW